METKKTIFFNKSSEPFDILSGVSSTIDICTLLQPNLWNLKYNHFFPADLLGHDTYFGRFFGVRCYLSKLC